MMHSKCSLKNLKQNRNLSDYQQRYYLEGLRSCIQGDIKAARKNLKKAFVLGHPVAKEILDEIEKNLKR